MSTYSYLVTDIKNTAENDSTEFADQIPYFINKSELQLTKDLDDFGLDVFTTITLSASNPIVSIPSGTRLIRNVNYTTSASSIKTNLLQRTYEYAIDYFPYASASTGTPRYYTRRDNSNVKIVPTPVSAITVEIQTQSQPLPLASATGTSVTTQNYFSEYCYNALFYGSMMEATMFNKDWNTVAVWQGQYQQAVASLRNQARRTRQDDMQSAANPIGGPDTVQLGST